MNSPHTPHTADSVVLEESGKPRVIAILRSKRLLYARRIFRSDQALLLQLLLFAGSGSGTWLAALITDYEWIKSSLQHKLTELPSPHDDIGPWITLTLSPSWRNLVNCAMERDTIIKLAHSPKQGCDEHQGSECGRQFASYPELQGHRHRVHGYKNPLRQYMPSSICLCCLKQFGTRLRLLFHPQSRSMRCADFLVKYFKPLDKEIEDALDRHDLSL